MMIEHKDKQAFIASLPKAYEPQEVEGKWYRFWEEHGYFKPQGSRTGKTFVISMPPPNVTGALHLGHAITATVEDILTRYHRMAGDETLWVPGEDHAGIATQNVVERLLQSEGTDTRSGAKLLSSASGSGYASIRAVFRISIDGWARLATGRESALRWMKGCRRRCAKCS
jgi:isoleucyl-tRNA synthetase